MKTAYIFHDAFSDPNNDWYPWMKTSLEGMGYVVVVPKFPTPAGQSYDSWKAVMKNYLDKFDSETVFIGHGIGGTFALRITEELSTQIHGLFLVASYAQPLGHVGYDRVNESFTSHTFNWEKIKNNTHTIKLFTGQHDPFVPEVISDDLAKNLVTVPSVIPEGGHINKASGFTQCVQILQGIKGGLGEIDKSMVVEVSTQEEQPAPITLESSSPSYQEGDAEGRGSLEKKIVAEAPTPAPTNTASHTMYQDMSKLVNSNEGRVASSLLTKARNDAEEKKAASPANTTNSLYIIGTLAVILIVLSIGIIYFKKYTPAQRNNPTPVIASLIQAETHTKIDILGNQSYETSQAILTALQSAPPKDTLVDIYYTRGALRASFTDVLDSLDLGDDIPESLRNEFIPAGIGTTPVFMHMNASIGTSSGHALILPMSHYDKTFSGMREWEPTLLRDLGVFMNLSPESLRTRLSRDTFTDEMIANRPLRILRENGQVMIGYFFLNDRTLIIVDRIEIIPEILSRYANRQIYR